MSKKENIFEISIEWVQEEAERIANEKEEFNALLTDIRKGLNRKLLEQITINGKQKHILNFYTPFRDQNKEDVASIYIFGLDVTSYEEIKNQLSILKFEKNKVETKLKNQLNEQIELNKRLRNSHKDLLNTIEAIDQRIIRIEYDTEGKIIKANSLYYKIVGDEGEMENIKKLSTKDKSLGARWEKVLQGQINEVLTKIKTKSGKEFWWNIIDIPIISRTGETTKVLTLAIDLTKEKTAEINARGEISELAIEIKKLRKQLNQAETQINILSEENSNKEKLIKELKDKIKRLDK